MSLTLPSKCTRAVWGEATGVGAGKQPEAPFPGPDRARPSGGGRTRPQAAPTAQRAWGRLPGPPGPSWDYPNPRSPRLAAAAVPGTVPPLRAQQRGAYLRREQLLDVSEAGLGRPQPAALRTQDAAGSAPPPAACPRRDWLSRPAGGAFGSERGGVPTDPTASRPCCLRGPRRRRAGAG